MEILDMEQRSPEWFAVKAGKPSPSKFSEIITTKGERSKSREKYLYRLAGEAVAGIREDGYTSFAMQRGIDMEDEAADMYELMNGVDTQKIGCIKNDLCGGSPDRLVGVNGGLEIKCPEVHTHVAYLLKKKLPTEYFAQVHGYLYITGREWWDFMSYYPGIKPFIVRVTPDKQWIEKLEQELIDFNEDLAKLIGEIQ